jgi:TRAP-type mannitol/chloroaromatic compound transport system substrate-binding protein
MKRRQLITGLGAGTLVAGAGFATGARAQDSSKRFNWRLVTTWPPNFPIFQDTARRFAEDIRRLSGRRLNIQVFAGGELVPPLQTFDAVSQGTVEMGHGAAYYWAGKIPAAPFFTAVPFGMNAQGMNAWLYSGGGLDLWREVYAPYGLVPFPMGNTGVQMAGWFRKRIESLADLKGLKMRVPGLGGKVMARAGVNPVLLAGGEIYTALERKLVDAAEWVGPFHDLRLGLYRAAKHYYYPGWQEPGPVMELIVNKRAWDSLPEDLQLVVETVAAACNVLMLAEFETRNLEALETLKSRYKVEVLEFPAEVIAELKKLTQQTLDEDAAQDPVMKKVYEQYKAFMKTNDAWSVISETAYARARSQ